MGLAGYYYYGVEVAGVASAGVLVSALDSLAGSSTASAISLATTSSLDGTSASAPSALAYHFFSYF